MYFARIALISLVAFCLAGCGAFRLGSLTESAPITIPTHTDRNQFCGQFGYGGKRGFDGNLSYAMTKHLAFGGSLYINQQTFHDSPFPGWSDGYSLAINSAYWEGQVSYFQPTRHSFVWAASAGYGSGSRQIQWIVNQLDARFNRYFIQGSGNWTGSSNWQKGVALKLHYTNYTSVSGQNQSAPVNTVSTSSPGGLFGLDLAQTIKIPVSSIVAFNG